jgi:hypothetical protein
MCVCMYVCMYVCIYIYTWFFRVWRQCSSMLDSACCGRLVQKEHNQNCQNCQTFCLEVSSSALSPPHIQHLQQQRPALFALSQIVLNYNEVLSPQPPQNHPSKSLLEIPHMGFADCEKKSSSQEAAQLLHESACLGVLKFSLVCFLGFVCSSAL